MEELREMLKNGVVNVKFTKADGTERLMKCTLQETVIPTISGTPNETRKKNEDVFIVYDLEKQGWRSFRKDSIIEYSL